MGGQITQPHAKVSGSHSDLSLKSLEETENMVFSQNVKLELYFRFILQIAEGFSRGCSKKLSYAPLEEGGVRKSI